MPRPRRRLSLLPSFVITGILLAGADSCPPRPAEVAGRAGAGGEPVRTPRPEQAAHSTTIPSRHLELVALEPRTWELLLDVAPVAGGTMRLAIENESRPPAGPAAAAPAAPPAAVLPAMTLVTLLPATLPPAQLTPEGRLTIDFEPPPAADAADAQVAGASATSEPAARLAGGVAARRP